jgi:hypothetical protein
LLFELDEDEGVEGQAELVLIDAGAVAGDDALGLEPGDPPRERGGREPHLRRQLGELAPPLALQGGDDLAVHPVHFHQNFGPFRR